MEVFASEAIDWPALRRIRAGFLQGTVPGVYWDTVKLLEDYDHTLGERIGWKWDAVLRELRLRGWAPPVGPVVDWGCGTGVAARRFLGGLGRPACTRLWVWDHSAAAVAFAEERIRAANPGLVVESGLPAGEAMERPVVLLSHVLGELDRSGEAALEPLLAEATAVVWVEGGSHELSRRLIGWRERLRERFRVVAPCTHEAACGLCHEGMERHWCHHFARPPTEAFTRPEWGVFAREMGVDLRALPFSFLVLDRRRPDPDHDPARGGVRILGRPSLFKGYARMLACAEDGVAERELQQRSDRRSWRQLRKPSGPALYHWELEADGRVKRMQPALRDEDSAEADGVEDVGRGE
ncbi:MAG: hypothetical protein EA425_08335 [Puniceicoccaceae bacterium]|nr:MAG: hypothetical protein EA425_08335 [Puniceicoccaceae bacterium]